MSDVSKYDGSKLLPFTIGVGSYIASLNRSSILGCNSLRTTDEYRAIIDVVIEISKLWGRVDGMSLVTI